MPRLIDDLSWPDAVSFVSQPAQFTVVSNLDVADKASSKLAVPANAISSLDGPMTVRPLDVLRVLGLASAMDLRDDVREIASLWAVVRYLGAFRRTGEELLALSEAGDRVRLNQRRVLSEDLGIAFGLAVASSWISDGMPDASPVWIADVDNLGQPFNCLADDTTSRRPDYVIVSAPAGADHVRMGLVECKGTSNPSSAQIRLTKACEQATPWGRAEKLPCLAVSGVFCLSKIETSALLVDTGPEWIGAEDPRVVEIIRASMLGLALFGGNAEGASKLEAARSAPRDDEARNAARRSRVRRARARAQQELGNLESSGVTSSLALPQGSLEIH